MNSEDLEIRERAFLGLFDLANLSKSMELRARTFKLMEDCHAREKSANLRQWIATSIDISCKRKPQISENPFATE